MLGSLNTVGLSQPSVRIGVLRRGRSRTPELRQIGLETILFINDVVQQRQGPAQSGRIAMSSQPCVVTEAISPGCNSTVVIADSMTAGPVMCCAGASASKR